MTFKQGPSNAMSICCDKDYFAFCEDASGNKLENCQDNLSGIAKRTANGAIDDSKSHLDSPMPTLSNLIIHMLCLISRGYHVWRMPSRTRMSIR